MEIYRKELLDIYDRYKIFSYNQILLLKQSKNLDMVTWEDAALILTEDQSYPMSKYLRTQLVPEEERSQVNIIQVCYKRL